MGAIKELHRNSPTFQEICADYSEMVTWVEDNCRSKEQPSVNCDYAQEVLKDLEAEIKDCLEGNHATVAMEHRAGTKEA